MHNLDESFWTSKYIAGYTGWDIGSASPPLYQYLCQIDFRTVSILVPGAGNAHEVASGWNLGLLDIHLLERVNLVNKLQEYVGSYNNLLILASTPLPYPLVKMGRVFLFLWTFSMPLVLLGGPFSDLLALLDWNLSQ